MTSLLEPSVAAVEPEEFEGRIGRYHWESEAWWPAGPRPPAGAPNVLLVVLDDVGLRPAGLLRLGPRHAHPRPAGRRRAALHQLPHHGALLADPRLPCSPGATTTRSGMGRIIDLATGFPGYDARIPPSCAPAPGAADAARVRRVRGGQVAPHARRTRSTSPPAATAGPSGKGFERWYGFFPGETHQFVPDLFHDSHHVDPPGRYEDGYHLTGDLVDHAIGMVEDLRNVDVDKPWFLYLATGACHSPHQTPPGWIERYRGRFDEGWDAWREATLERPEGGRHPAAPTPSCPPGPTGCRRGRTCRPRSSGSTPGTWRPSPPSSPTPTTSSAASSTGSR